MNHALIFSSRSNPWERSSGAHRIATYLRNNGMDIEVVDFTPYWNLEILKEFVRKSVKPTTLFFGFSIFFSFWNKNMQDFTAWLKITYPHIKLVAGGQSILHAKLTHIDIWVDSYGEEAILAVAKSLAGNTTAGIKFSMEHFGEKKVIKSLESYPAYNLGDYSIVMEKRDFLESWEWLTVEFSRGCKFSCAFCNFPVLGVKEDTSRSAESFEYEMKYNYDNFGIDRYFVADETFNDRIEKITKFANVVEKLDFDPFFAGFIRADLLSNSGMTEELARMNFGGQYYGIETFNQASGKVIGKGLDPEKIKQLLLDTKNYFKTNNKVYRGTISLIVGLPYDTKENWDNTMSWLNENWTSEAVVLFPLNVEDIETTPKQDYTKLSKFGLNLKKYGLRSMGVWQTNKHNRKLAFYNWVEGNYTSNEVLWEHDTMNIFEAKEISAKHQETIITNFSIDTWGLSWPEVRNRGKIDNLAEAINVSQMIMYPYTGFDDFIQAYSLKKLN